MANGFLCSLFPFLLGLTLILFLVWGLFYLARPKSDRGNPSPTPVGILWLSPACAAALGRCSQPGRLRSMSARGISARLDRYDFPANEHRPTREQYSTWPDQADLICQGKFDELASKQKDLKKEHGVEGYQPEPANLTASRGAWTVLDAVLVLAFICAVLTLLNWILMDFLHACSPPPCKTCPPVSQVLPKPEPSPVTLKLSTDQEFEYDESKIIDPQRLKNFLEERLVQFKNAKLAITGFTDPIGGACHNQDLAKNRANAIAEIVREIVPEIKIEPTKTAVPENERSDADKKIAAECIATYQKLQPEQYRPLRGFTATEIEDRGKATGCTPDSADLTPNHILGHKCVPDAKPGEENKSCVDYYYGLGKGNNDKDKGKDAI
jgi:outer membrane protein OmpA-like peptidoglycan-associated protein